MAVTTSHPTATNPDDPALTCAAPTRGAVTVEIAHGGPAGSWLRAVDQPVATS
jgi:hypothetical protein